MKKLLFLLIVFLFTICSVRSSLPLSGKFIIIDAGHGDLDVGTSNLDILEKDLNLNISKKLEKELIKKGASVLLTRDGDYDLSYKKKGGRKKNDFDNRIKVINGSSADLYLSIHINYLKDKSYYGAQVFYNRDSNKQLAQYIQKELNNISMPRSVKKMNNLYMYDKLKIKGVLIECGFISNEKERKNLVNSEYQERLAINISQGIINYFK